jgi:hypothetical protein
MEIGRIVWSSIIKGVIFKFLQLALKITIRGACCVVPVITNTTAATSIFVGAFPPREFGNVLFFFDQVGVCHRVVIKILRRFAFLNTILRFVEMVEYSSPSCCIRRQSNFLRRLNRHLNLTMAFNCLPVDLNCYTYFTMYPIDTNKMIATRETGYQKSFASTPVLIVMIVIAA